jgi:Putative phage replication protein RstA
VNEEKEELTAIIDWLQMTFHDVSLEDVLYVLGFNKNLMYYEQRGRFGYVGKWCYGGIEVLIPAMEKMQMGYHVYMTGSACREMEIYLTAQKRNWFSFFEQCLEYRMNVSRLDIAVDDRKAFFSIKTVAKKVDKKECVTDFRNWNFINGGTTNGSKAGCTLNMGSRKSKCSIVLYEKNYEQARKSNCPVETFGAWNRYEMRMRGEVAINCVKELVERKDICFIGKSVLNTYVRMVVESKTDKKRSRWKTWKPWEELLKGMERIKLTMRPAPRTLEQKKHWLEEYVAPTLKMVQQADSQLGLENFIENIIEKATLKEKQEKIVKDYIQGYSIMQMGEEKRRKELNDYIELIDKGFMDTYCEKDIPFV